MSADEAEARLRRIAALPGRGCAALPATDAAELVAELDRLRGIEQRAHELERGAAWWAEGAGRYVLGKHL